MRYHLVEYLEQCLAHRKPFVGIIIIILITIVVYLYCFLYKPGLSCFVIITLYRCITIHIDDLLILLLPFLKDLFFNFLERGREGEREGEKHQCVKDT